MEVARLKSLRAVPFLPDPPAPDLSSSPSSYNTPNGILANSKCGLDVETRAGTGIGVPIIGGAGQSKLNWTA